MRAELIVVIIMLLVCLVGVITAHDKLDNLKKVDVRVYDKNSAVSECITRYWSEK